MGVKMNLRIITKKHAADPEIGLLTKSISKPYGRATVIPTAWEFKFNAKNVSLKNLSNHQAFESSHPASYGSQHSLNLKSVIPTNTAKIVISVISNQPT